MKKITKLALLLILALTFALAMAACAGIGGGKKNPVIESVELTTTRDEYYQRQEFDRSTCTITATFVGGQTKTLTASDVEWNVPSFDSAANDVEVSVEYQGQSDSVLVNVLEDKPIGLVIEDVSEEFPLKVEYELGETLNVQDGMVRIKYEHSGTHGVLSAGYGMTAGAEMSKAIVSGYDQDLPGEQTLTVELSFTDADGTKYDGIEHDGVMHNPIYGTFKVNVDDDVIERIIVGKPEKSNYELGDALDLTKATVQLNYGNGNASVPKSLPLLLQSQIAQGIENDFNLTDVFTLGDSLKISGYDPDDARPQSVSVEYKRTAAATAFASSFSVTVREIDYFELVDGTLPFYYEVGDDIDYSNAKIQKVYTDGEKGSDVGSEAIAVDFDGSFAKDESAYNKDAAGEYGVKITYTLNATDFDVLFNVKVRAVTGIEVVAMPNDGVFWLLDDFTTFGLQIRKIYDNNPSEKSDIIYAREFEDLGITVDSSEFMKGVKGTYTIYINVNGVDYSFTVEVIDINE